MEYVTDWLNNNIDQYNKIKGISQAMDLFQSNEGLIRLPMDLKGTSEDDQFLEIHGRLTELEEFYDKETGFLAMEKWTGFHASMVMQHIIAGKVDLGAHPIENAMQGLDFYNYAIQRGYDIKINID